MYPIQHYVDENYDIYIVISYSYYELIVFICCKKIKYIKAMYYV